MRIGPGVSGALALLLWLCGSSAAAPRSVVYRGASSAGTAVTFRVAGGAVVDFQVGRLDVQSAPLDRRRRFHACNNRAATHPCLRGRLLGAGAAAGTVTFGQGRLLHWHARAIGSAAADGGERVRNGASFASSRPSERYRSSIGQSSSSAPTGSPTTLV